MAAMAKWPRSKGKQATIASVVALLAAAWLFVQIEYGYFRRFYFDPHKAYPYPYPNEHSAQIALYRDCGFTLLGLFVVLFAIQRMFFAARHD
jgi:hypothetical protein